MELTFILIFFHFKDCPVGYYGKNYTDKCKHPLIYNVIIRYYQKSQWSFKILIWFQIYLDLFSPSFRFFGMNRTEKCKHPTFRFSCLKTCDWPDYHHIIGCISTAANVGNVESSLSVSIFRYRSHIFYTWMKTRPKSCFCLLLLRFSNDFFYKCTVCYNSQLLNYELVFKQSSSLSWYQN